LPGLFTSQDCCSRRCKKRRRLLRFARNRLSNLMLLARNDEITTLSSIARDDVVNYREWATTKAMWRDWLARRAKNADEYKELFLEKAFMTIYSNIRITS